ncbi:SseB family protein [Micromonospora sp. WMMD812]|uniref:SseB family protein n=1 Tax=Micromonospora sp. WMMD812 TaxID=3015152 RepID=UPI00248C0F6F|nr:SseB family protein [Micromonospora sp. WMMD812]WBB65411.1 SseB family protein [Micromonospora sp. WMMD812]
MTEWEPATEAEAAMRDALRAGDQELYFRILARTELLLPVSAQPSSGQAGWGTWTTGGRTHVLAFTSSAALRACLGDNAGATRRIPYAELAAGWPNPEWWLAVNPGLPVEGYLPAWFVTQLSRGDVRLPGRTLGARARLERAESLARARASGAGSGRDAAAAPTAGLPDAPAAGRTTSRGASAQPADGAPSRADASAPAALPRRPADSAPGPRHPSEAAGPAAGRGQSDQPHRDSRLGGRESTRLAGARPAPPSFLPPTPADASADQAGSGWPPPRSGPPGDLGRSSGGRAGAATTRAEGDGSAPGTPRSFFEPASGRGPASVREPGRSGDRATPPSRFARGEQPFPRRRPFGGPAGGEPTQAFFAPDREPTPAPRFPADDSRTVRSEASGVEATQPLPRPDPRADEPTRAFRFPTGTSQPSSRGQWPEQDAELTQRSAQRRTDPRGGHDVTEELPPSVAEPVSSPPAPRRGFTPIVIEGTIVESRDLPAQPEDETASGVRGPVRTPRPADRPSSAPAAAPADPAATQNGRADAGADLWGGQPAAPPPPSTEPEIGEANDPAGATAGSTGAAATPGDGGPSRDTTGAATVPAPPAEDPVADFQPANAVEEDLLGAAGSGSTDTFLSTLLLARVLLPVHPEAASGSRPGDPGFVWRTEELDGERFVVVYTSPERMADHADGEVETVRVKFVQLIRRWPDEAWSFAVNPGTPVGAKLPGEQIVGLANWAAEVGLGDDGEPEEPPAAAEPAERPRYTPKAVDPSRPVMMQKAIAPSQLAYYLERGYDRVSGFVHRANELAHLNTPAQLYDALGLGHPDSPFSPDADEIYVLRWPAHRPSLYRIPYGGQNEPAMRAMEGWVIERAPFRGNGFAPGESSDVVAEFKVDSARLPHGAQLWRLGADGSERVVASLDTDALRWREVPAE